MIVEDPMEILEDICEWIPIYYSKDKKKVDWVIIFNPIILN